MSDAWKTKNPPSEKSLKVQVTLGIPFLSIGLVMAMPGASALGAHMGGSVHHHPWVHDPFIYAGPVGLFVCMLGISFLHRAPRRLTWWYEEVVDGVVVKVYEDSVAAIVRGVNRVGRNIELQVKPPPAKWKTLLTGARYPWDN
jgi:hypothetical protein